MSVVVDDDPAPVAEWLPALAHKPKRELEWRPAHPSWRQGFAAT